MVSFIFIPASSQGSTANDRVLHKMHFVQIAAQDIRLVEHLRAAAEGILKSDLFEG